MAKTSVTTGLKCAPEIGPSIVIRTTRIAPVGIVLPRSETAVSSESLSPMIPEPTTVATRIAVPNASAARRRRMSNATSVRLRHVAADVVQALLKRELVDRGHRQAYEDRDAVVEHAIGLVEGQ